ncbi:hypothetical protein [Methanolobus sp.]|nr:hypothetical protein [Methanolobus sp.]
MQNYKSSFHVTVFTYQRLPVILTRITAELIAGFIARISRSQNA